MHGINYEKTAKGLMNSELYHMMMKLHEYKGEHRAYLRSKPELLNDFHLSARLNGMEGISCLNGEFIAGYKIKSIYEDEENKPSAKEALVYGYRDLMSIVTHNYDKIFVQKEFVERLYFELKKYQNPDRKRIYRIEEYSHINVYQNHLRKGTVILPSIPIRSIQKMLNGICEEYVREAAIEEFDLLLLIPLFILDLICINPFSSNTFTFAIALFSLLLYKSGYMIGQYISLEKLVVDQSGAYVNGINKSIRNWESNENDYSHFVKLTLETVILAYERFFERYEISDNKGISKPEKVKLVIRNHKRERITKKDIIRLCPDISLSTVEHTLNYLLKEKSIQKVGGGRSTGYIYIGEEK